METKVSNYTHELHANVPTCSVRTFAIHKPSNCDEVGHLVCYCKKPNQYKGHKCKNCGKMNHHESKCRQQRTPVTATAQQPQAGLTNSIWNMDFDGFVFQVADNNDLKSVPRINVVDLVSQGDTGTARPRAVMIIWPTLERQTVSSKSW